MYEDIDRTHDRIMVVLLAACIGIAFFLSGCAHGVDSAPEELDFDTDAGECHSIYYHCVPADAARVDAPADAVEDNPYWCCENNIQCHPCVGHD